MEPFNWTCPHCSKHVTIVQHRLSTYHHPLQVRLHEGLVLLSKFTTCPNPECLKITIEVELFEGQEDDRGHLRAGKQIKKWRLIPASPARHFPDYVPEGIRSDYTEACLIRELSPKAAATLARRALQGILIDFWQATPTKRLVAQIKEVETKVDPLVWEAIDAVRKIGNIGAHMEHDIGLIVDIEPQEAELLIGLLENLIEDTYISRFERVKRARATIDLAAAKKAEQKV